jgi:hypothetical protein
MKMVRAIVFKEWLKIRWTYVAAVLLFAGVILNIALDIRRDMNFNAPMAVWSAVVFMGYQFYHLLCYVPLLIGIAVGVAQFVPEVLQSKLKLALHLPIRENSAMLQMVGVGLLAIVALFLVALLAVALITVHYFPVEVLSSVLITVAPWFLAGIGAYLVVATVITEPRWIQRVILILLGYGALSPLFVGGQYEAYRHSFYLFVLLIALWSTGIVLSGHRFRRGVR